MKEFFDSIKYLSIKYIVVLMLNLYIIDFWDAYQWRSGLSKGDIVRLDMGGDVVIEIRVVTTFGRYIEYQYVGGIGLSDWQTCDFLYQHLEK